MEAPPPTNYLPGSAHLDQHGFRPQPGFEYAGVYSHLSDEDILIQYAAKNTDLLIDEPITHFKDKAGLYLNNVHILVKKVLETDLKFKVITLPGSNMGNYKSQYRRWPQVIPREPDDNLETHPYLFAAAGANPGDTPENKKALAEAALLVISRDLLVTAAAAAAINVIKVHLLWRKWIYPQDPNLLLSAYKFNDNWKESFNYPGNKAWTEYGNSTRIQKFEFTVSDYVLRNLLATDDIPKPNIDPNILLKTIIEQTEKQHRRLPGQRHLYAVFTKLSLICDKLGSHVKLVGSWNSIREYIEGHGRGLTFVCGPGKLHGEKLFGQLPLIAISKYVLYYDNISRHSLKNLVDRMTSLSHNGEPSAADRDLARKARSSIHQENYLGNSECPWIVIMAYLLGLDRQQEIDLHELFVFYGGSTIDILIIFAIISYISCKKKQRDLELPICADYAREGKGPVYLINIVKRTVGELITEINNLVKAGIIPNNTIVCVLIDGHITTMLVSNRKLAFVELQGKNIKFIDYNEDNHHSAYFFRVTGGWRGNVISGSPETVPDGYTDGIAVGQLICIPCFARLDETEAGRIAAATAAEAAAGGGQQGGVAIPLRHTRWGGLTYAQSSNLFDSIQPWLNELSRSTAARMSRDIIIKSLTRDFDDGNPSEQKATLILVELMATIYLHRMAMRQTYGDRDFPEVSDSFISFTNNLFTDMLKYWIDPYFKWREENPDGDNGPQPRTLVEWLALIFNFINGYDPTIITAGTTQEKKWGFTDIDNRLSLPLLISRWGVMAATGIVINQTWEKFLRPLSSLARMIMGNIPDMQLFNSNKTEVKNGLQYLVDLEEKVTDMLDDTESDQMELLKDEKKKKMQKKKSQRKQGRGYAAGRFNYRRHAVYINNDTLFRQRPRNEQAQIVVTNSRFSPYKDIQEAFEKLRTDFLNFEREMITKGTLEYSQLNLYKVTVATKKMEAEQALAEAQEQDRKAGLPEESESGQVTAAREEVDDLNTSIASVDDKMRMLLLELLKDEDTQPLKKRAARGSKRYKKSKRKKSKRKKSKRKKSKRKKSKRKKKLKTKKKY